MNIGSRFTVIAAVYVVLLAPGCKLVKGISKVASATKKSEAAPDPEPAPEPDTGTRMEMSATSSGLRTVYLFPVGGGDGSMVEACAESRGSATVNGAITVGGIRRVIPATTEVYPEPDCEADNKPNTARIITEGEAKLVYTDADSGCSGSNRIPADKAAQIADGLEPGEVVTWQTSTADQIQPYTECLMRHAAIAAGIQNAQCVTKDKQLCTIQVESRGMVETCTGGVEVKCASK